MNQPASFQPGAFKGTPKKKRMMSVVYKCSNCPGNIYAIRYPEKLDIPIKCGNCSTMNTRYKIKQGYLVLFWYRIKSLWQKSTGTFVKDAPTNSEVK